MQNGMQAKALFALFAKNEQDRTRHFFMGRKIGKNSRIFTALWDIN